MKLESQQYLLKLARQTLEHYFQTGKKLVVDDAKLDKELKEPRGTFVTLHTKTGELRGCIGHIEPMQAVYLDVIDNALSAGLEDSRFSPLQEAELADLNIDISILTIPYRLKYSMVKKLLASLRPNIDGVIIKKGAKSATYLPQVWEDITNKEEFLTSLCLKAGLRPDEWKTGEVKVYLYQAEVFHEHKT